MQNRVPHCFHHTGRAPKEKTSLSPQFVDARTTQSFHLLRLNAEDWALELSARLRVLGKSLATACTGHSSATAAKSVTPATYENLRQQLDAFLGTMCASGSAGQHYFPAVHYFLQQMLPHELHDCIGDETCRIARLETVVALLSDMSGDNDEMTDEPLYSCSF